MSNMKTTRTRTLVLNLLTEAKSPLSANDIYKNLSNEGLTLSTIYRTLDVFVKNNLIKKETSLENNSVYIINEEKHTHFLECTKCHKRKKLDFCPYHNANKRIKKENDFEVDEHNLIIYGVCKNCRNDK